MKFKAPVSWQDLSEWQLQQIAHLYLHADKDDFDAAFLSMVFVAFRRRAGFWGAWRLQRLVSQYGIVQLADAVQWLTRPELFSFPEITGLLAPSDRLLNITVKQFSYADRFFHDWETDRTEIKLRRFVASLYRIREDFDEIDLPAVAAITEKMPEKQRERIALSYLFCRMYIWEQFPVVFPKPPEEAEPELVPVFKKPGQYQSFDKVIMTLVFSENQPLGNKQQADATRIYPFLSVLTETMLRHREKEKQNAKH